MKRRQRAGDRPDGGVDVRPPADERCLLVTRSQRIDDRVCSDVRPALCEVL